MKAIPLKPCILMALFGVVLGYSLARMGFSDYDELHRMFTFTQWRLFFTFVSGLALSTLGIQLLMRGRIDVCRPIHKGTVPGGAIFGLGWALSGACPAIPLVQIGQGRLPAVATVAGIAVGIFLFDFLRRRSRRLGAAACMP